MQYLVGYHRRQIGAPFYQWLASAVGSGILGAVIAHYVEIVLRK